MGTPAGNFTYAYDAAGRPTSLTNPFSETTSWGYQNNNWFVTETLPNSVIATYTRNAIAELTDLSNKLSGQSTALSDFGSMAYDGVGNRFSSGRTLHVFGHDELRLRHPKRTDAGRPPGAGAATKQTPSDTTAPSTHLCLGASRQRAPALSRAFETLCSFCLTKVSGFETN